jgi:hypothetical protein
VAGVVIRRTAENVYADFLFAKSAVGVIQTSLPQIEEEVPEAFGLLKLGAAYNSFQEFTVPNSHRSCLSVIHAITAPSDTRIITSADPAGRRTRRFAVRYPRITVNSLLR